MQDRLRELVKEVEFHPPRNRQFLLDWMDNISIDWPISRRRWYHTEIPVWYADSGSKVIVPPKGAYVQPWREDPPSGSRVLDRNDRTFLGTWEDLASELSDVVGEEKVFDTWMDSSNSNLFVSGLLEDDDRFERCFPTALRPQGKEIVRTWLYYTMLKSALLLDRPAFKHVWIDGLGMDPWGRKMSKSRQRHRCRFRHRVWRRWPNGQLAHQGTRRLRGPQGQQDRKRMFPLVEGLRRPSRR